MNEYSVILTSAVFILTVLFLMWRPRGMNEAVPTSVGAAILLAAGIVPLSDVSQILNTVSGAAITILSTIVMSIVLESIGFFRWAAFNIIRQSKGSGIRLYWYILLLCFLMTMFFNNDGSILITTPIIIQIVTLLRLKPHQKIPYLLSGALVATASSAPIGISNLANLIALKIVGLDLNSYAELMFVPSMAGIVFISMLLYSYYYRHLPKKISPLAPAGPGSKQVSHAYYHPQTVDRWMKRDNPSPSKLPHPLSEPPGDESVDWKLFRICISVVVFIRAAFFAGEGLGIPIEWIAVAGAIALIAIRKARTGIGAKDLIRKTPWHIIIFAFSIYVVVFGLHNIGFTAYLVDLLREPIMDSKWNAVMITGGMLTVMSNLFNNLPSVMIGTLSLTEMGLDRDTLQLAYLANIIGSDVGSLLTPVGTLASLIWMFIIRKNKIKVSWTQYMKVTLSVIPAGLFVSLLCLYIWVSWIT